MREKERICISDLINKIIDNEDSFKYCIIIPDLNTQEVSEDIINLDIPDINKTISFIECEFEGCLNLMNLTIADISLRFKYCRFEEGFKIEECLINKIWLENTYCVGGLGMQIYTITVKEFVYRNNYLDLNEKHYFLSAIDVRRITVTDRFKIENVNVKGPFVFSNNTFPVLNETGKANIISFENSIFKEVSFYNNKFLSYTSFENSVIENITSGQIDTSEDITTFKKNEFNKVNFRKTTFKNKTSFNDCNFNGTTVFELSDSGELEIQSCLFKKFTLFDESVINSLNISHSTFETSASFFKAKFTDIRLHQVKFLGGAFFDEISIKSAINDSYLNSEPKIISEWKRTFRTIKYELAKTENRIDYAKFRVYELKAYYKELTFRKNFGDKFILLANKWSSGYGKWYFASLFTLVAGLFWYILFYISEHHIFSYFWEIKLTVFHCKNQLVLLFWKNPLIIFCESNVSSNNDELGSFISGLLRFFVVTEFKNPLLESPVYITNPCSWIFFILGKIFISFGIYETVQSFRKFRE